MKNKIGFKVYAALAILGILYVATIMSDIMALGVIRGFNNNLGNVYLKLEKSIGDTASAYQQVQLYANLIYLKKDTDQRETLTGQLQDAIRNTDSYMDEIYRLSSESDDAELYAAYETYQKVMDVFLDYSNQIYDKAAVGDDDGVWDMVNDILSVKTPVEEAKDAFENLVTERADNAITHSEIRINGTATFDYTLIAVFVFIAGITTINVSRTLL